MSISQIMNTEEYQCLMGQLSELELKENINQKSYHKEMELVRMEMNKLYNTLKQ